MTKWRNQMGRTGFLAVCLFALQSILGAYAAGAQPMPLQIDAFGNTLCITSDQHAAGQDGAGHHERGHGGMPECCLVVCAMGSSVLAPPPQTAGPPAAGPALVHVEVAADFQLESPMRSRQPGSPRGPPPAA